MRKLSLILFLIFSFIFYSNIFADDSNHQLLSSQTQRDIKTHMKILSEFRRMYENKHFEKYLFDIKNGYLQTSISGNENKMPLNFFVEYNNMWWFAIIDKVVVPAIGYDYENNTGFIVLNIYYDKTHILRGTQYITFNGNKINYIRTYGSPTFFTENLDAPRVKLDSYGNQIWLTTGYDLTYSAKAALLFFDSPVGKSFISETKTEKSVKRIKQNLKEFLRNPNQSN